MCPPSNQRDVTSPGTMNNSSVDTKGITGNVAKEDRRGPTRIKATALRRKTQASSDRR
jgi:hypothetical protein